MVTKMKGILIAVVAAGLIAAMILGCGSSQVQVSQPVIEKTSVRAAEVRQQEIAVPVHSSGLLSSKAEIKLSFKVGGIIEDILFDEGDSVKAGQVLARLNTSEINANVAQAESSVKKAKQDLERLRTLYADDAGSLEQLQSAEYGYEIAKANLQIAKFNQAHSIIHAPSDGKIFKRLAEKDEITSAGVPIFLFGSTDKEWVIRVGVTDRDIVRLKLKDKAEVKFDAYPDKKFAAVVTEIAENADPLSGTFEIELTVNKSTSKLVSGFVGKADIFPSEKRKFSIIPVEALVEADGKSGYVYALNSAADTVTRKQVKIGWIFEDTIAVSEGLDNIEYVITDGAPYLVDGALVNVVEG